MIDSQPVAITLDGRSVPLGLDSTEPLVRAVIISLFTWRRANPDDDLPGNERMGWWGDTTADVTGDRIGSRLWLLMRSKLTDETVLRAREYAAEALQWLVDDGIVARFDVQAERIGIFTLGIACQFYESDGTVKASIRFADVWSFLK